jgi:hypothetical protein
VFQHNVDSAVDDWHAVIDRFSPRLELSEKRRHELQKEAEALGEQAMQLTKSQPIWRTKIRQLMHEAKTLTMRVASDRGLCQTQGKPVAEFQLGTTASHLRAANRKR